MHRRIHTNALLTTASWIHNGTLLPFFFAARPRFRRVSQNAEVSNRQRALLLCRLPRELSDIVVKWTKLPNTPVYPGPRYWVTKSKALRFYANQKTAGVYQCSATVGGVNITHNAMIAIKGALLLMVGTVWQPMRFHRHFSVIFVLRLSTCSNRIHDTAEQLHTQHLVADVCTSCVMHVPLCN